jgi:GTPase SAR1 family protein
VSELQFPEGSYRQVYEYPILIECSLVAVGELDADKTLLLYAMVKGHYPEDYVPTVLVDDVVECRYVF